jgi:hypothetical protein
VPAGPGGDREHNTRWTVVALNFVSARDMRGARIATSKRRIRH